MDEIIESDTPEESATVAVEIKPNLKTMRAFFSDMLAVIDKYDDGKQPN